MTSSLPPEIWFTIIDHLPRNDQLRISRVSPHLCAVARRIVYRNIELRSDHVAIKASLALLARDYSVARNVIQLHIYTAASAIQQPAWFNADVLAGMTNLRQLDLTGLPFRTKEDQLRFNTAVAKSLPALQKLRYYASNPKVVISNWPGTHVPVLHITGLQEITWIDEGVKPARLSRPKVTH